MIKKNRKFTLLIPGVITLLSLSLFSTSTFATRYSNKSITEIVASSGGEFDHNRRDFDILLKAVLTAGLEDNLADPNADLTVFAPNDRAFVRLARNLGFTGWDEEGAFNAIVDTLTELGDGDPIPLLTNILLYHVSPEAKSFRTIVHSESLETLLLDATIVPAGNILLDNDPDFKNAKFYRRRNIKASNGIIHVINRVLIPIDLPNDTSELDTITEIVAASEGHFDHNFRDFDILLNAVLAADLDNALDDPKADITVFAPNDAAFIRLARNLGYHGWSEAGAFDFIVAALTDLGNGDPIPLLTDILLYHVSPTTQIVKDVISADSIDTLLENANIHPNGSYLIDNDPEIKNPRLKINRSDIRAVNGIVHTINRVLIPLDLP